MTMIYERISLLINLLEGKDYNIDNTNYQKNFCIPLYVKIETTLIKHTFF